MEYFQLHPPRDEVGSEASEWEKRGREEQLARMVEEEGRLERSKLGERRGHMPRLEQASLSRQLQEPLGGAEWEQRPHFHHKLTVVAENPSVYSTAGYPFLLL